MEKSRKPILLTGSHRSGTTWAGKILSSSNSVGYIMEPFNDANNKPGIFRMKFGHYFPYINENDNKRFFQAASETISFRYNLLHGLKSIHSGYELARLIKDWLNCMRFRLSRKRPFIKDPNALFMSEWLYNHFDFNIIVLIRHPAAFVSSLLLLNWFFPFSDLLKQKHLMKDHLSTFEDEMRTFKNKNNSLIDEAILAWRLLHYTIYKYQQKYKEWTFVRHEDLSRDPESEFRKIFGKINLDFDNRVKKVLQEFSGIRNPSDTTNVSIPVNSRKSIKRNSQLNIWNWKNRLDAKEIIYIRERVEPIASNFYGDLDW